ncbi:MFS transporter [Nocardia sp. NPDC060256]|uniref:MFS transporter n=1 Tax=unclassified Nocardia TaxID=2637762 RepID=UPI003662C3F8
MRRKTAGWGVAKVLGDRNAGLYLSGVIVSGFGDSAMLLVAGVWVKSLTGSNSLAALVNFCVWLPTLFGPAIGTVADRVRRRRLLIVTKLTLAAVLTVLFGLHSREWVWLLFAVLTVVGIGAVLADAAEIALVATAVPAELRADFNGLVRTAIESMKLVAPAAGVGIFVGFGGTAVALLDSVTFLLAAAAFAFLRIHEPPPVKPIGRTWRAELAAGVRYIGQHRALRSLVLAGGMTMAASSLSSSATFAMLDTGLHRSATFVGVLTPVQGLGSVVSGLLAGALLRRTSDRTFAACGIALFALGVLARTTPWFPVVLGGSLAIGLGLPCPLITAFTAVQRDTPNELLGRVAATTNTLVFAPITVALPLGSAMVAAFDYRVQTVGAGILAFAAAAVVLIGE